MPSETGCGVVFLVGGSFALGDLRASRASPVQRGIGVDGYVLDAYEVTVSRFRRFWEGGRPTPATLDYASGAVLWRGPLTAPRAFADDRTCNWSAPGRD